MPNWRRLGLSLGSSTQAPRSKSNRLCTKCQGLRLDKLLQTGERERLVEEWPEWLNGYGVSEILKNADSRLHRCDFCGLMAHLLRTSSLIDFHWALHDPEGKIHFNTVSCDSIPAYKSEPYAEIRALTERVKGRLGLQTYGLNFITDYPFLKSSLENLTSDPVLFTPISVEEWINILTEGKRPKGLLEEARKGLNIPRISRWLRDCLENHKHGISKTARVVNMRLIDVETNTVVLAPEDSEYIALSYVWGDSGAVNMRNSTGLPSRLPHTVKDAITLTKCLNYRYLWVDSICIDQSDLKAREEQCNQMDKIYKGALLVVVAASGRNANSGLPGISSRRSILPSTKVDGIELTVRLSTYSEHISRSLWVTRGWTMQEYMLAQRRLVFTGEQVFYHCPTSLHAELDYAKQPELWLDLGILERGLVARKPMHALEDILWHYAQRQLTWPSDILRAAGGLMGELSQVWDTSFIFGFPKKYFPWVLSWNTVVGVNRREMFSPRGTPVPLIPTWSWAAWHWLSVLAFNVKDSEVDVAQHDAWVASNAMIWEEVEKTGILRFEADVGLIKTVDSPEEPREDGFSDETWAWVTIPEWVGQNGRFAMWVSWKDNIAYRVGRSYISDEVWKKRSYVRMKISLG